MSRLPQPVIIEGEVLGEAVLDAREMCSMNFARDEFHKLYALLYPMCSSHEEGPMCDIARHLEQVIIFTGNFMWKHRHLGASHGVVGEEGGGK
ncbi:hypothetical protein [Pseudomonas sp. M2]|uniref:hypothetical protein n=1 Tax=Pseudomonas sp. M2 TaxID=228756 RepID=UPI0018CA0351|nr:hypothetical protein [Pseudomonas sp. M2]MBG6126910.1 hypothetical protein [Pseudomonas sp. M2]HDS1748085.1 hypothetical protein [Pseudomonas putida]